MTFSNDHGATYGKKQPSDLKCDDTHVKGFDCSGLSKYAVYQGCGISLYHGSNSQYNKIVGTSEGVDFSQRQAGDLIFFGTQIGSVNHVGVLISRDVLVEASGHNPNCSGKLVQETPVSNKKNPMPLVGRFC